MVRLAPDYKRREHVLKPAFVLIPQCLLGWIGDDANFIAEVQLDLV